MKNIVNWTCGSFFRSIGRILSYLFLGGLIAWLLSNTGFKITDLFLERVDALSMDGYFDREIYVMNNEKTGVRLSEVQLQATITFTNQVNTLNDDYAIIPIEGMFTVDNTLGQTSYDVTLDVAVPYFHIYLMSTGSWTACEFQNNFLVCPVQHNVNLTGLSISINPNQTWSDSYWTAMIYMFYNFNMYKKDTSQVIENQNQNTQEIIESQNETQQTIQNSTNQTISTITDSTSPDVNGTMNSSTLVGYLPPGPLDSVLNLPLSILNNLVSKMAGTCSPLVIDLPFIHRNLTIPCIDTIFSNIQGLNTGLSAVFGIIGALMLYNYLIYLYTWVDEITSLRHARPRLFGAKSDAENWGGN